MIPKSFQAIVICPYCGNSLAESLLGAGPSIACPGCQTQYPLQLGQPDLRLQRTKMVSQQVLIGDLLLPDEGFDFVPLRAHSSPEVDIHSVELNRLLKMGNRLTPELLTYFPKSPADGGRMLDLGCGDKDFEQISTKLTGFNYVGCDYCGKRPDLLADGHALPFASGSFGLIISFAVLEHIRHPFVFMNEVYRVMKPGATFLGTIAFLEPFHMKSYYHASMLGTYNLLKTCGLDVLKVAPNLEWDGLRAIAKMSLYPRMPELAYGWLFAPARLLHRAWWKLGNLKLKQKTTSEEHRINSITGGFRFVAKKPA